LTGRPRVTNRVAEHQGAIAVCTSLRTTAGSPARARASFEEAKPGAAFDPVLGWLSGL